MSSRLPQLGNEAIESLLDAVGARPKLNALDLCRGQGNVSGGTDSSRMQSRLHPFFPAMLVFARTV